MTRTEWILKFYNAFSDIYKASPDIADLESITSAIGCHNPIHLGALLLREDPSVKKIHPIIDAYIYNIFFKEDPIAIASQTVEAIIKIGIAIGLSNIAVTKMAKTNRDILGYYFINYFTEQPGRVLIKFKTLELEDIVISIDFIKQINMRYMCLVNDRFCEIDNLPDKLKKLVFNK